MLVRGFMAAVVAIGAFACGGSDTPTPQPMQPVDTAQLIAEGWQSFSTNDFATALARFEAARQANQNESETYTGLGWTLLRLDSVAVANARFSDGSRLAGASADLFAGWAFVLNILGDFAASNAQADNAIAAEAQWTFTWDATLTAADLQVLKAENFFLLGMFTESLAAVQVLNPAFAADTATPQGQMQLAAEIERQRGLTGSQAP